jgi:hypothetical protein
MRTTSGATSESIDCPGAVARNGSNRPRSSRFRVSFVLSAAPEDRGKIVIAWRIR